jgi:raffinose/stachyose/melibiose transport system permease protein
MNQYFRNWRIALVFMLPALILYTLMVFYPVYSSLTKSFFFWSGLDIPQFAGIANYTKIFSNPDFLIALRNCLIYSLTLIIVQVGGGLVFSFFLVDRSIKGRTVIRKMIFIPVVLSIVVTSQLWKSMLHGHYGLLNKLFEAFGIAYRQDWLGGDPSAIITLSLQNGWQFLGLHLLIIYAAVKSVPEQYMEAAQIEGASELYMHRIITIPLIKDTIIVSLIIAITGGLQAFENIFVITGGGPAKTTYSLTMMLYDSMFRLYKYGYGSAVAVIILTLSLVITVILNITSKERVEY